MADNNLSSSIAALINNIKSEIPNANPENLKRLARSVRKLGYSGDATIDTLINNRANALTATADATELQTLAEAINQVDDTSNPTAATNVNADVHVGDAAPESAVNGDLWWKTDDLNLYVYYEDGDGAQWIQANSTVVTGAVPSDISELTDTTGLLSSGGGVTVYANLAAFPSTENTEGDFAFAQDTKALYVWDGTEWDRISSGPQIGPRWITTPPDGIALDPDGNTTSFTVQAVDESGFPVTYDWDAYSGTTIYNSSNLPPQLTSVTESNGTFTLTPSTDGSDQGVVSFRTKAGDGVLYTPYVTTLDLSLGLGNVTGFIVDQIATNSLDVWYALLVGQTNSLLQSSTLRDATTFTRYPSGSAPSYGGGFGSTAHSTGYGFNRMKNAVINAGHSLPDPYYYAFISSNGQNSDWKFEWTSGPEVVRYFAITGWTGDNTTYLKNARMKLIIGGVEETDWRTLTVLNQDQGYNSCLVYDFMA